MPSGSGNSSGDGAPFNKSASTPASVQIGSGWGKQVNDPGCTGNSLYGIVATPGSGIGKNVPSLTMPGSQAMPDRFAYMELSREDLMCIEKLGEGPNGEVTNINECLMIMMACHLFTPINKYELKGASHKWPVLALSSKQIIHFVQV